MNKQKGVTQHPRQLCYFCGSEGPIQTHHIVPQRFNGSDLKENLVDLCPNCHERIERLYDKSFYDSLGVEKETNTEVKNEKPVYEKYDNPEELFLLNIIESCNEKTGQKTHIQVIHHNAMNSVNFLEHQQVEDALEGLMTKGKIYEPKRLHYSII